MKKLFIIFIIGFATIFGSCRQVAKKALKEAAEETIETGIEKTSKKVAKEAVTTYGERLAQNSDMVFKAMMKNNPVMGKALKKLRRGFKGSLDDVIKKDKRFSRILQRTTTLENFDQIFTKGAPKAAKDIDAFKFYLKVSHSNPRFANNLILKESKNGIQFISKIDNQILGELKNGVMTIKGTHSPLLKNELYPKAMYKILTDDGGTIICKMDDLGRIVNIKANNISAKDIDNCLIGNTDYGPEIRKLFKDNVGNSGKFNVDCKLSHTGDHMEPSRINVNLSKNGKMIISNSVENSHVGKSLAKDYEKLLANKQLPVQERLNIAEELRIEMEKHKNSNPKINEQIYASFDNKNQKLLDDLNDKIWKNTPVDGNKGKWSGNRATSTYSLNPGTKEYEKCAKAGMTECKYNLSGSPDFSRVTEPNSIVDASDLYDKYTSKQLEVRGGGNNFQDKAQERMAKQMENQIKEWWKINHPKEKFNLMDAFYKYRDSKNLVPHEDVNGQVYLVNRDVHRTFTHSGGISRISLIKEHDLK